MTKDLTRRKLNASLVAFPILAGCGEGVFRNGGSETGGNAAGSSGTAVDTSKHWVTTADCTVVPVAADEIIASDGAVWTLVNGVVLRNGVAPSADPTHDVEAIVAKSGTIYLQYHGDFYGHPLIRSSWPSPAGTWASVPASRPCSIAENSDCTVVPGARPAVMTSDGAIWTISGGIILRNGVQPSADPTHDVEAIVVKSGVVYLLYQGNYYGHPVIRSTWPSPTGTWGSTGVPVPCTATATDDCTVVPTAASDLTTSDGAVWRLSSGVVLRNGVAPSADPTHDVEAIVAKSGVIYLLYQGNYYGHPAIRGSWPSPTGTWGSVGLPDPCAASVTPVSRTDTAVRWWIHADTISTNDQAFTHTFLFLNPATGSQPLLSELPSGGILDPNTGTLALKRIPDPKNSARNCWLMRSGAGFDDWANSGLQKTEITWNQGRAVINQVDEYWVALEVMFDSDTFGGGGYSNVFDIHVSAGVLAYSSINSAKVSSGQWLTNVSWAQNPNTNNDTSPNGVNAGRATHATHNMTAVANTWYVLVGHIRCSPYTSDSPRVEWWLKTETGTLAKIYDASERNGYSDNPDSYPKFGTYFFGSESTWTQYFRGMVVADNATGITAERMAAIFQP